MLSQPIRAAMALALIPGCGEVVSVVGDAGPGDAAISAPGDLLWQVPLGTSFPTVTLAPDGSVLVAASLTGDVELDGTTLASTGGVDVALVSLSPQGRYNWSRVHGGPEDQFVVGASDDAFGNLTIRVMYSGVPDLGGGPLKGTVAFNAAVARYDATGEHLWSTSINSESLIGGFGVATDGAGNTLLTGDFSGPITFPQAVSHTGGRDIFVARLREDATAAVLTAFGSTSAEAGTSATFDNLGTMVMTGSFADRLSLTSSLVLSSAGGQDVHVVKLDLDGSVRWARSFGSEGEDTGVSVATDRSGNIYIAGIYSGPMQLGDGAVLSHVGSSDIFVLKLLPTGEVIWAYGFGSAGVDRPRQLAVTPDGQCTIVGEFSESIDFGGDTLVSQGFIDGFVAVLSAGGEHQWSRAMGSPAEDRVNSVAVSPEGIVTIGVSYRGSIDAGGDPLVNTTGEWNSAVVQYRGM